MPDPAVVASKRRWKARNLDKVRASNNRVAKRRAGTKEKRGYDAKWREENRYARRVAQRCNVSIKVARMWVKEGRVPARKYKDRPL